MVLASRAAQAATCGLLALLLSARPAQADLDLTQDPPLGAATYTVADSDRFNLTDFNDFLYSTNSSWIVVPAGNYSAPSDIADNVGEHSRSCTSP